MTSKSRSALGTWGRTADPIATTASILRLTRVEVMNVDVPSRDLSVGQRRTWRGAWPRRFPDACFMLRRSFHKRLDGIHVPFDLRSDIFRIEVGRRDVTIRGRFSCVIQVVKQLLGVGQPVLLVEFDSDFFFPPMLLRSFYPNTDCARLYSRLKTVK